MWSGSPRGSGFASICSGSRDSPQQPDHRGATDPEALGDFPITVPLLPQPFHFRRELANGRGPPMRFPILSSLVDSRFHTIPQDIPLELRKHGRNSSSGPGDLQGWARAEVALCSKAPIGATMNRSMMSMTVKRWRRRLSSSVTAEVETTTRSSSGTRKMNCPPNPHA